MQKTISFCDIPLWLARIECPVSEVSIHLLQEPCQMLPIVGRLGALDYHKPVPVHLKKSVSASFGSWCPFGPRHGSPKPADFVSQINTNDERVLNVRQHNRLPVLDPFFLGLPHPTDRTQVVIGPAGITRVGTAAPGCARDMVVNDDCNASFGESLDNGVENVESPQAHQVAVRTKVLFVNDWVIDNQLIRIR
ncbi:hypothetical protein HG531_002273 [Fusarium graminearum]|nr:hypothetical protein HG531_002273 [Fusarium graminearum]